MRHAVERISTGTWAAYAQARLLRSARGDWPSAETLLRLAEDQGGDGWALLVLTRGELPRRGDRGRLERVFDPEQWTRPLVEVPTCEALWACVLESERLYAYLHDPRGRELKLRWLHGSAVQWDSDERMAATLRASP